MAHLLNVAPIARTVDTVNFPGVTEESRSVVQHLLEDNNKKHHIFFNESHFHNHVVHHILDAYSLGSSPARLHEIYNVYMKIQRPIPPRTVHITTNNWLDHLGNSELWTDYLDFFNSEIAEHGMQKILDKYFFHHALIGRIFSGIFHPFIHIGFGVEFHLPMIVSEGLALAALHENEMGRYITEQPSPSTQSESLMSLVEQVANDDRFDKAVNDSLMREYLAKWCVQAESNEIRKKQKELYEFIALVYAAVTPPGKVPKFDFYLMHALTSSLFVHVLLQHFSLQQQADLLKAHFSVTFLLYISRGRPKLYVENLRAYKTRIPENPNRWIDAIKFAVTTPDVHAMKVICSLLQAEALFGDANGIFLKAAEITVDSFNGAPRIPSSLHKAWDVMGTIGWGQWESGSNL